MKKGDEIEFNFHAFGKVSKEKANIWEITKYHIQIEDENEECMYKFCRKTGKCLNDNTDMGCKRTMDLKDL